MSLAFDISRVTEIKTREKMITRISITEIICVFYDELIFFHIH